MEEGRVYIRYYAAQDGSINYQDIQQTRLIDVADNEALRRELARRIAGPQPTSEAEGQFLDLIFGIPLVTIVGGGMTLWIVWTLFDRWQTPDIVRVCGILGLLVAWLVSLSVYTWWARGKRSGGT